MDLDMHSDGNMGKKIKVVIINLIVIAIVVIAISDYIHSDSGYTMLASVMGEFPFSKYIVGLIYKFLKYENDEIPLISSSSIVKYRCKFFMDYSWKIIS